MNTVARFLWPAPGPCGFTPRTIGGIMRHARRHAPAKTTFREMRSSGARGLLIYCADFHCSHSSAISANPWPDDVRLSDIEPLFTCQTCGRKGADVRLDFHWNGKPVPAMRYR
jgi:hypothetical protein